jgi:hypothetical protein
VSPIRVLRIADPRDSCNVDRCPRIAQRELRIDEGVEILAIRLCAAHLRMLRDVVDERTG